MSALFLPKPDWARIRVPALFLICAASILLLQLVPLPPDLWQRLPDRAVYSDAAFLLGLEQPWRPLSISPSSTMNALASLVVPATILILASYLSSEQQWRVVMVLLGMVVLGALIGLLQFTGLRFSNPFLNATPGSVSGNLANRNHFGLFLAIGCALSLVWSTRLEGQRAMSLIGLGICLLFVLLILVTGSRASLGLGLAAIIMGLIIARARIAEQLASISKAWRIGVLGAGAAGTGLVWLIIRSGRAASVDRALADEFSGDSRSELWQVVLMMTERYMPFGTGFGTFDRAFRLSEPDAMLRPQYYNQAHNDWLQAMLEGGLLGLGLVVGLVLWFVWRAASIWGSAWRKKSEAQAQGMRVVLAQLGTVIIALVMAASLIDYPARTPIIMAVLALASVWICKPAGSDLPQARSG
ncbi:O-antigen ligase family protein [Qipengyuania sp. DGS5-3]|uniref:O-antigen ligase family protein n=1 Tax=Qipengyuania sp. DGS5-3 TaxID=3349632 RepID=UPI0036D2DE3A